MGVQGGGGGGGGGGLKKNVIKSEKSKKMFLTISTIRLAPKAIHLAN